jgi:hypothetical protein
MRHEKRSAPVLDDAQLIRDVGDTPAGRDATDQQPPT